MVTTAGPLGANVPWLNVTGAGEADTLGTLPQVSEGLTRTSVTFADHGMADTPWATTSGPGGADDRRGYRHWSCLSIPPMPSWSLTQLDRTENTKVSSLVMVGHCQVMVGLPTIAEAMDTITIACH